MDESNGARSPARRAGCSSLFAREFRRGNAAPGRSHRAPRVCAPRRSPPAGAVGGSGRSREEVGGDGRGDRKGRGRVMSGGELGCGARRGRNGCFCADEGWPSERVGVAENEESRGGMPRERERGGHFSLSAICVRSSRIFWLSAVWSFAPIRRSALGRRLLLSSRLRVRRHGFRGLGLCPRVGGARGGFGRVVHCRGCLAGAFRLPGAAPFSLPSLGRIFVYRDAFMYAHQART